MKKKKIVIPQNYLEQIPMRKEGLRWKENSEGMVTLEIDNKGWVNRVAQILFGRPKVSYVHLDELGSFVWPLMDGKMDIVALGKLVDAAFGERAHPLYERLAQYFRILDSYHFIEWKK